uniref:Uncharacterized protein n=1 Tax=Rhizophagus irregularis (strain DAOM 181602 / DAOM 197198 / MUCL 43194) TaxID=747089 RepID=U9UJ89_RHIID
MYPASFKDGNFLLRGIIDMNNNTKEIKLYDDESIYENHCTFNVKVTKKNIRIFADEDDEEIEKRDIRISSNERFICLSIKYEKMDDENFEDEKFNDKKDLKDKIIVYSIELGIPIASLDINDDISLYDIMKDIDLTLYPLLLTLFDRSSEIWNSIMKYYWKVCLDGSNFLKEMMISANGVQFAKELKSIILEKDVYLESD